MIVLFRKPQVFEERKPFAYSGAQRGEVASAFGGLAGNVISEVLSTVHTGITDAIDTITGAKANAAARAQQIELAKVQADAASTQTLARTAAIKAAAPWVGLALVGVVLVVAVAKK